MVEELWEKTLVEQIKMHIDWCGVLPYPERPESYFLKHGVGEILVRYENTRYTEGDAPQHFQNRSVTCELIFVFRRLRGKDAGAQGLYFTLDAVRNALYNYRLPNATSGIQFVQEDMLGENNGIWQYGMKINFKGVYVHGYFELNNPAHSISVKIEKNECDSCSAG